MKGNHRKIIEQLVEISKDGKLGIEIEKSQKEYDKIRDDLACIIKYIYDVLTPKDENDLKVAEAKGVFSQYIILAYRESKKKDEKIANALLNSFVEDYPTVSNSCLLLKWRSLAESILSVKEIVGSKNRLDVWQRYIKLFQSYNEFLNGLLSYLILCWKCHLDEDINTTVFSWSYGKKINEFEKLTDGENGVFYLIFRIVKNQIRNAIAHGEIRFDTETGIVHYLVGTANKEEKEMNLDDFMVLSLMGSVLAQSYL